VVAGQHQDQLRVVAADDLEVLVDRVRCALVPVGVLGLLRGQQLDELVEAPVEEKVNAYPRIRKFHERMKEDSGVQAALAAHGITK